MKKLFAILALTFLLVPAVVLAQPPAGCLWGGDPYLRYGFGEYTGLPYNQPGIDVATMYPGGTLTYVLAPYNAAILDLPTGSCRAADTFCFHVSDRKGWTIACAPPMGDLFLLSPGFQYFQGVSITVPCGTAVGAKDTILARVAYANIARACAPECGDCNDPNIRVGTTTKYYNADTLIVTVIAPGPMFSVLQDTLTLVERGLTSTYVPFAICNEDDCAPLTQFRYNIKNVGVVGRIPTINVTSTIGIVGGDCKDVFGVLNLSLAAVCDYDVLTIIVWNRDGTAVYDTCVQRVHVVEPVPVPLFTVPVVTILVLALILAAAVFMRRRAVSRA